MEIYVDIKDLWKRTGLTVAACDACDRDIFRGGGHLLTTEEVTRSRWYREHCVPQALREVKKIMNISLSKRRPEKRSCSWFEWPEDLRLNGSSAISASAT